jgi:Spy/CpxP family protein refolding chaperone
MIIISIKKGAIMKKIIGITVALGLISSLFAEPNIPLDKAKLKAKMAKVAGEPSPFNKNENFPKDYFLIPKNLPFAIGITLHHPRSSELGLSKEQIAKIVELKKSKKGAIVKSAKEIKDLELKLLNMLESKEGKLTKVTKEMSDLVDEIAKRKAELTKAHLQCIIDVQNVLTKEQRAKVADIIGAKNLHKSADSKADAKSKVDYLKIEKEGKEISMGLLKAIKPIVVESLKKDKSGLEGVEVCAKRAKEITDNYNKSLKNGWSVRRTAIKYRSPDNKPDRVDLAVMEKIIKDGNFSKPLITDVNGTHRVYMPLVTKKPCLACHGENIDPKTKEEIVKKYPNDLAIGFKENEFRGVIVAELKDK